MSYQKAHKAWKGNGRMSINITRLLENSIFTPLSFPDRSRDISDVYIGDLLSWVMGRAKENSAWITIMSNSNVIAVATLTDASCVILAEGVTLEDDVLKLAMNKGVNVFSTHLSAFEASKELQALGL